MPNVEQLYAKEVFGKLGYHATWMPNADRKLGGVGRLEGSVFAPERHLTDFGIDLKSHVQKASADIRYHSEGVVKVTTKAKGQAPIAGSSLLEGQAGISIEFGRAAAVYLDLQQCLFTSFEKPGDLADEIILRYDEERWDHRDMIITELCESRAATILISGGRAAHAELVVEGELPATAGSVSGGTGLSVVAGRDLSTQITTLSATPLFSLGAVKRGFLEESSFRSRVRKLVPDSEPMFYRSSRSNASFVPVILEDV